VSSPGPADGRDAERRGTARARLLDAALAELSEHGYAGTSLQAIAKRAQLTRGAVYWNFASKQELFLALLDERIDQQVQALMRLTETAPADQPTADSVGAGLAHLIDHQAPLVMLLFDHWAAAVRDSALRPAYITRHDTLRKTLAGALAARHATTGVPLTFPAERLATAILALSHGIAMNKLINDTATSDELLGEILDLLYDGLVHRARTTAAAQPDEQ
jgi:AcrR family transcriptional regulator